MYGAPSEHYLNAEALRLRAERAEALASAWRLVAYAELAAAFVIGILFGVLH